MFYEVTKLTTKVALNFKANSMKLLVVLARRNLDIYQ